MTRLIRTAPTTFRGNLARACTHAVSLSLALSRALFLLLTFRAVIALPAGHADAVARLRTLVVAERVVARPAQVGAALAVVVLVAGDTEIVLQRRVLVVVAVLRPLGRDVQHALNGQARDQRAWRRWKRLLLIALQICYARAFRGSGNNYKAWAFDGGRPRPNARMHARARTRMCVLLFVIKRFLRW